MLSSKEVIRRLEAEGWQQLRQRGSHLHFGQRGSEKIVTVPHPKKDLPKGTLRQIFRTAGWEWPP